MYYYQLERACGLEIEHPAYNRQNNNNNNNNKNNDNAPSPRFAHCSCVDGQYFYVWGGRNQTQTFCPVDNILYRYHLPTKKWNKIKPNMNPLYNSRDTYNGSNPQPRYEPFAVTGATAIVYKHCIYIFGGYHSRYTNQLLKYDIYNNYWSVVDARGDIPQRRWEYSACIYRDKMYIFGGTLDRTHFNDLFSFNFETLEWTELSSGNESNRPRPRRRHKAVVYRDKMYIFGGREEPPTIPDELPTDLQIYSFSLDRWSVISCADSSSSISIPIAVNHSLFVSKRDGLLYVFGCQDAPIVTYDFKLNRWYPVSSRNYERHGLSLCTSHHGNCGYYDGSLYIFGGISRDKLVKGDLLKFSLNPQPQYTRDMLSMLNNKNLSDIQFKISCDDSIVYAHKFMLVSRCEYFAKMFSGNFAESAEKNCIIQIDNCSKKVFKAVLRYFYTDELWVPQNVNDTLEMLALADLYQFKIMRKHCCEILENSISISNAILLLQAARKFNLNNLKIKCKDFILANFANYQNKLGLFHDLIELITLYSNKQNKEKNNNDKQENDDDDDDDDDDEDDDDEDNECKNEWKALHNEIMDAMGKLLESADNNRILTETQKRLQIINLSKKDIDEYKKTHQDMIYAAKYGNIHLIKKRNEKITTLDDNEEDKDNDDDDENDEEYDDYDDDDDEDDEDDDEDDDNDEYSNHFEDDNGNEPKRRRLNNNNNNNNNILLSSFNINNDSFLFDHIDNDNNRNNERINVINDNNQDINPPIHHSHSSHSSHPSHSMLLMTQQTATDIELPFLIGNLAQNNNSNNNLH